MSQSFILKLLTPYQSIFEDEVEAVILPGELGEFGVLFGHTKFITKLIPGIVRYVLLGETHKLAVSGGFAEVHPGGVTVLADSMEKPEDIDMSRAEDSRRRALESLKARPTLSDEEIAHLEAHLARAENRIRLAKQS